MSPTDPLASARAKLGHAQECLSTMRHASASFLATEPYSVITEVNPLKTERVFHFHPRREERDESSLIEISLLAGDVIQNARSALDHMVFALANQQSVVTLTEKEERRLQFPITGTPEDFADQVKRGRLAGIKDRAFIEAMQPYPTRDGTLAELRDLSDIDKHRRLHLLFFQTEQANVACIPPSACIDAMKIWDREPLVDNAPVLCLVFPEPRPDVDVQLVGFRPGLGFEPVGIFPPEEVQGDASAEDRLAHITAYIESAVRDEFARRF